MNNILIVAKGQISKTFIKQLAIKDLSLYNYIILTEDEKEFDSKITHMTFIELDPTSLFRLRRVCREDKFVTVFIIIDDMEESLQVYYNIRVLNKKVRVVALDLNFSYRDVKDSYLNSIDVNTIIANRLYDFLPNVPVTAQTIGLNQGEIMEVDVPFASSYAFRHISSIPQIKWRIVAIYRENKLILPTNATMIKPRDRLLLVGKPQVLTTVFNRIKSRSNNFPEPFGRNFYLCLDIDVDAKKAIDYIEEAIYILDRFDDKELTIRVINPNDFEISEKIKKYENDRIRILFSYLPISEGELATDLTNYDIGLILISNENLKVNKFNNELYAYKKLIYIYGDTKLSNIQEATIIKSDEKELEEISSIAFYIAETLKINLALREYEPDGNFNESRNILEHYETLSHVHNVKLNIIQEKKNPIKAVKYLKRVLLIVPFRKDMSFNGIKSFINRDVDSLLLKTNNHSKLLISITE